MTIARIAVALIGFLGAIFWTWWVPVICMVLLSLRFRAWEVVILGTFMDLLWLSPGGGFHGFPVFTVLSIAIVWVFEPLRVEFLAR